MSFQSPSWSGQPQFPDTLTKEELFVARQEYAAIPEFFYTCSKLPMITPLNIQLFIAHMRPVLKGLQVALWSWCAGSGRLLLTMMMLPFGRIVLFPVDLRFGWDLRCKGHQILLLNVDKLFQPCVTTFEPRCKYWSRAGHKRDPRKTAALRADEVPMLRFMSLHIV